jgi:hypothetical protein
MSERTKPVRICFRRDRSRGAENQRSRSHLCGAEDL